MSGSRNQSEAPIGVFDSGVGGLTVVRQLRRVLPHEDLVYLGDTARVPYGTKSPDTVIRFALEDTEFLARQRVKAVVVACNTASAWAVPALERAFRMPVFGVILPGARGALESTRNGRVGIIATNATIRSQAYTKAILSRDDQVRIFARSCPLLVPLVEEGWTDRDVTRAVLREYLDPLLARQIDTLVLGCTHYPLLKEAIQAVVGPGVTLVDSAASCADFVRDRLGAFRLLNPQTGRPGQIHPYVTDEVERFEDLADRFLGEPIERAWKVDLPSLLPSGSRRRGFSPRGREGAG
jgi:glutamate racemase